MIACKSPLLEEEYLLREITGQESRVYRYLKTCFFPYDYSRTPRNFSKTNLAPENATMPANFISFKI